MYPYPDRIRWFLGGRYAHLIKAVEQRKGALRNPLLRARVNSLRTWNQVRAGVIAILSLGIAAAATAWLASYLDTFNSIVDVLRQLAAAASASSGALTVIYLGLTRTLGQLEVDILAILSNPQSD